MAFERSKQAAAEAALQFVESGMVVGLGTGSTSLWMLQQLAVRVQHGLTITAVPTSKAIAQEAIRLGVPLVSTYPNFQRVDVALDGADEVDPQGRLIKGGGGALLQEKLVATASSRLIIMVDESKLVQQLGQHWALPVEVVPFGWTRLQKRIEELGAQVRRRELEDGSAFLTDQGNYIFDCNFGPIADPESLQAQLIQLTGVIETGLFLGATDTLVIGREDGSSELRSFKN